MNGLEIPAVWLWGAAAVWIFLAIFLMVKGSWLSMPERSEAFPFSARQFFFMLLGLLFAFGGYIASFLIAHTIVSVLKNISGSVFLGQLTLSEWLAVEQIVGLVTGIVFLAFVRRLLPKDLVSLVAGKAQGWKPLWKGALYGVLFVPLILVLASVVGWIVSLVSPESRAPQVALEMVANVRSAGVLFWLLVTCIVVLVPSIEETLFRGFLQTFLLGLVHPTLAVFLTSGIFAAFHYSPLQKSSNFEIMIGLFVFSLLASKIREKEGALGAAIGLHAAFNATSLCLYFWQP